MNLGLGFNVKFGTEKNTSALIASAYERKKDHKHTFTLNSDPSDFLFA